MQTLAPSIRIDPSGAPGGGGGTAKLLRPEMMTVVPIWGEQCHVRSFTLKS